MNFSNDSDLLFFLLLKVVNYLCMKNISNLNTVFRLLAYVPFS